MTTTVFLAVLGAAVLHAAWNALVKSGRDKVMSMGAIVYGHVLLAIVVIPFVPFPEIESWPYLIAGVFLHVGYQIFLINSYKFGDLTQVYPIARGSAPLMVALVSVFILGVTLNLMETFAILIIGCGIISLALVRQTNGQKNTNAAMLALITGMFIAGYSIVDGIGARLAGSSLSFFSWLVIGNGMIITAYLALKSPRTFRDIVSKGKLVLFLGGTASFVAYAIVIWAFTQAPIALVTALRETSIAFALLIGVFFLKEPLNLLKVLSTFMTLLGAVLLRFARP